MAETRTQRWTVEMLAGLPEDDWVRYELVDGEVLVSRAPGDDHQATATACAGHLFTWNEREQLCLVLVAPGVIFGPHDHVVPDIVWVSRARRAAIESADRHLHGAPELIVEVLSPGAENARRDREVKLGQYSRFVVAEYWSLDPQTTSVQVYRHDGPALRLVATLGRDDTLSSPLLPSFGVQVGALFPW
jgi:Uma2 family endonuclease